MASIYHGLFAAAVVCWRSFVWLYKPFTGGLLAPLQSFTLCRLTVSWFLFSLNLCYDEMVSRNYDFVFFAGDA